MNLALTELLLAPILYVNDAYFKNGFKSLVHGAPTMDALIAIGATASVAWSIYGIYRIGAALAAGATSTWRTPSAWTTSTWRARAPSSPS